MEGAYDISNFSFPEVFISDAGVARDYIDAIKSSHEELWDVIEKMEAHIDGKKPKDPKKLKDAGKIWANNWNYGKARAKLEKTCSENIDTVMNALHLCSIHFGELTEEEMKDEDFAFMHEPRMRDAVSNMIEAVFIDTIDQEPRMNSFINRVEYNTTSWGWCAVTKDFERDWMGYAHHIRGIGFEEDTKPEEVRGYATFDTLDGEELWRLWHRYQGSENLTEETDTDDKAYRKSPSGWIIEGLEEAIYHAYNGKFEVNGQPKEAIHSFSSIVPLFEKNPSYMFVHTDTILISKIYKFEFEEGKFTTTYIAYGNSWANYEGVSGGERIRYKDDKSVQGKKNV